MEDKINELVQRLMNRQDIEYRRPEKNPGNLMKSIEREYVLIVFKKTGTEIGIKLNRQLCKFDEADLTNLKGKVYLTGSLILNFNKVKCIAEIDLATCEGKGYLCPLSDEEYTTIMS